VRLISLAASVGLLLAGFVRLLSTPSTSGNMTFAAVAWAIVIVCTGVLAGGLLVIVAVARRRWRPSAATAAGALLVATIATFPVERTWFDAEYSSGTVPLAQSLAMQRLPGDNGGTTDGWFRPPPIAYTESCCS
jgi:hypothetical protein